MKLKKALFGYGREVDTDTANVMQEYSNEKLKTLLSSIEEYTVLKGLDVTVDAIEEKIYIRRGSYIYSSEIFKVDEDLALDIPELQTDTTYYIHIKPKLVQDTFWSNYWGNGYKWLIEDNEIIISENDNEPGYIRIGSIIKTSSNSYISSSDKPNLILNSDFPKVENLNADLLDGLHAEELSGSKIINTGFCSSGEPIPLPESDFPLKIDIIPIVKRNDFKAFPGSRPSITSITGGLTESGYLCYYTVVARDFNGNYSEPSLTKTYNKRPHQDANITISWTSIDGATDYVLFAREQNSPSFIILTITTNTSYTFDSISGETGNPYKNPVYRVATHVEKYEDFFVPFIWVDAYTNKTQVNLNYYLNSPGTSYVYTMPENSVTNLIEAYTTVAFRVCRIAFSGPCNVRITWKIGIAPYYSEDYWERTYVTHQYIPGSGLWGDCKEYYFNYLDIFRDLDPGRYKVRWTFVSATIDNGNYWWEWHWVRADKVIYYDSITIEELNGIYIVSEERGQ